MTEREIFLSALEIEDPAARQMHVHGACAGDTALLARVEALLTLNDSQSQFLETPVMQQMAGGPDADSAPTIMYGDGSTEDQEIPTEVSFDKAMLIGEKHADEPDEIPLGYLEPSDKPGSLGRLAHYEVLQVLGRGAFGIVLKARDEKLERVVAIKVLAPEIAATSPARKRFLREARASGAIRHEHVVNIHGVDEKPLPYLVMEYIPGQTLQQRLDERGPLDVATTVRFGKQIAEGLAAAHDKDLIHRDIKPGNILLEAGVSERVKITDFGLARAADDASMTQSGLIAGTPMYMAPEQALGRKLDQRADLFSLGSVLYQMVSGRPPFRASGTLAVLKRVTEDEPRPISEIIPETPTWLCDIIARLHAKDPDDRYQSAQEVADVLADCEEQLKTHGRLKDFSKIPRRKPERAAGRWKWIAAATLLLPAVALATTESLGITHLFHKPRQEFVAVAPTSDPGPTLNGNLQVEPSGSSVPPQLAIAPFDAAQAQAFQEAWAKHLGVPVEVTNSIGMKFRLIPPGEFMMGTRVEDIDRILAECPEWASHSVRDEAPQRRVVIDKAFYLGATEVTIGQFREFVRATDYKTDDEASGTGGLAHVDGTTFAAPEFTWRHPYVSQSDDHPMAQMTASDVEAFCRWLGKLDGKTYDLPSDSQWEHACRAGTTTFWSFGDGPAEFAKYVWANGHNEAASRPVGLKLPNPFGLYDMHGNVEELCRHVPEGYRAKSGHAGNHVLLTRSAYQPNFGSPGSESWRQRGFRLVLDIAVQSPGGAQAKAIPVTSAKQELAPERVALEFDGANSYVATPLLYDGSTPLTVEVAVQIREWPVHKQQYHSEIVGCTEQAGFGLGTSKEGIYFSAFIGTNYATVYSPKDDRYLNRPIKLAGIIDGQSLRLFIDGKQIARNGFEHRFKPSPEKISLGTSPGNGKPNDGNGYDWAGKMYEVRISNTARYTGDYDASAPLTADGNTMALYQFDEGAGDVLHDASNNGRHGKIVGAQWMNAGSPRTGPPSATTLTAPPAGAALADADRRAAEYVLSIGGWVQIDDQEQRIHAAADLTREPFRLTVIDLAQKRQVSDAGLAIFKDCRNVKIVALYHNSQVTNAGLAHFQNCKAITQLHLQGTAVTDAGLAWLQDSQSITDLYLSGPQISDTGLASFKDCKGLGRLSLSGTRVSDAGLAQFKGVPLRMLWINNTGITDLTPLQGLPLVYIRLTPQNITRGLDILRGMTSLKSIGVESNKDVPAADFWERYDKGEFTK